MDAGRIGPLFKIRLMFGDRSGNSTWSMDRVRVTVLILLWHVVVVDLVHGQGNCHCPDSVVTCCGGGGFFFTFEDFGRMFNNSFPACTFFLKWRLAHANKFHSLGQDQSTVAQRAETTVTECSLTHGCDIYSHEFSWGFVVELVTVPGLSTLVLIL